MLRSDWTPSIVPGRRSGSLPRGRSGSAGPGLARPTAKIPTSRPSSSICSRAYKKTIGIFCFNAAEGLSRDVSEDIAHELRRCCDLKGLELPETIRDFVERHAGNSPRQ